MLAIGPYKLPNSVALAPMAGATDLPTRQLCRRWGAGLLVSEMVNANPDLKQTRKTRLRTRFDADTEPRSVQIAGSEPAQMAAAAKYNVSLGAQIVDINMGCPAKKVCRKAAGSALLADERLVKTILQAVVNAVSVPVTLKIRTGVSPERRNGVGIARIAEDAGVAALAVHGRTRRCAFKGDAEYDTIAAIVEAVDIPVFANGDIDSPAKAATVMTDTGAAGVMVGRAAQGQPWLCGQIAAYLESGVLQAAPPIGEQLKIIAGHVEQLHRFYGEFTGLRIARKHVGWYLQKAGFVGTTRSQFNRLSATGAQLDFLAACIEGDFVREALAA